MAARSHEARRLRLAQAELHADGSTAYQAPVADQYRLSRLARTRKQLAQVDRMLEAATDAREVKSLADALARLADMERILAGRPLPGSRRPRAEHSRPDQRVSAEPLEA